MPTEATADYLDWFFLRMDGPEGLVMTKNESDNFLSAAPMIADPAARERQLFQLRNIDSDPYGGICVVNKAASGRMLGFHGNTRLELIAETEFQYDHLWLFGADRTLRLSDRGTDICTAATMPDKSMVLKCGIEPLGSIEQTFELVYPADYTHIRHCMTGKFLTAHANGTVAWEVLTPAADHAQQWAVCGGGRLTSRAFAKVLQIAGTPAPDAALEIAPQMAPGTDDARQRFDVVRADRAFHSRAGQGLVISIGVDNRTAIVAVRPARPHPEQELELVSPLQFFYLYNGLTDPAGTVLCKRGDDKAGVSLAVTPGDPTQHFTFSRYDELLSRDNGKIVDGHELNKVPNFLDRPPSLPFGNRAVSFLYFGRKGGPKPYGDLGLRESNNGLVGVKLSPTSIEPQIQVLPDKNLQPSQLWRADDFEGTFLHAHLLPSLEFFTHHLPAAAPNAEAGAPTKQELVAYTIAAEMLRMICGLSPEDFSDQAKSYFGHMLLQKPTVRGKVDRLILQGVTRASIADIALALTYDYAWPGHMQRTSPPSYYTYVVVPLKMARYLTPAIYAEIGASMLGRQIDALIPTIQQIVG